MSGQQTDLTFFTNDKNQTLLDRFKAPLSDTKYLVGILNSEVTQFYLYILVSKMRGGYFSMSKIYIQQIPIPHISYEKGIHIETLVDYTLLLATKSLKLQSKYFEQIIDGPVYELYFPEEIKASGKAILPHLGELPSLEESMSENEKLKIIQREFDRLYDPAHQVRNNVETLDSVEVAKIIRDALKR